MKKFEELHPKPEHEADDTTDDDAMYELKFWEWQGQKQGWIEALEWALYANDAQIIIELERLEKDKP